VIPVGLNHPDISVILPDGHGAVEAGLGPKDYIIKLVNTDELIRTIRSICKRE
jgi:hypothetical protein